MAEPNVDKELRKAKRAERRAKQREENAGRAEKMHQARLQAETEEHQSAPVKQLDQPFYIGCSGWYYWHWHGTFYPEDIPRSEWFPYYAKRFDTVELNAPFYSWPTVNTVKSWLRQAGRRRFIYTVKVCELITHVKRFEGTKQLVKDFGYIADLLGPRMGCFLFQLPPSYQFSRSRLKQILGQLDHSRRNVVEFRHRSWWNEEVYKAFRKTGTIFCSCSGPRLPDELVATAKEVYIRFHGTTRWYRHDYSKEELAVWVERVKQSGAKRVWAYFNNDQNAYAIRNARAFLRLLEQADIA